MEAKKTTRKKPAASKAEAAETRKEPLTLLGAMNAIVHKMTVTTENDEVFNQNVYTDEAASIDHVCKILGIIPRQTVILAALVEHSSRHGISPSSLACDMGLSYIETLSFRKDFRVLEEKGYITIDDDQDMSVPESTISAFSEDKASFVPDYTCNNIEDILGRIRAAYGRRENGEIKPTEYVRQIDNLLDRNPNLQFSKECFKLGFKTDYNDMEYFDRILFYTLIYRFVYEDDDRVGFHDFKDIVRDKDELVRLKRMYNSKQLACVRKEIVVPCGDNSFFDRDYFHLSDEVKDRVLGEIGGAGCNKRARKVEVMKAADVVSKELFFNAEEDSQISKLMSLLENDNYRKTTDRLKSKGLRTGFTCLFYGGPGTGKTETVYQLARRTGRDILPVNVNEIKSCWVGESEKLIKAAFDNYRRLVEDSEVTPILLFNEADAIFGIRREGATDAVDKMENSIQNIILQEMEKLSGILIATTNLTENLDKAFERRFLYKICFHKPEQEVKRLIWRSMIPELTDEQAGILASGFDFSGGQIENITRKREIRYILDGVEPGFEEIRSYCGEETIKGRGFEGRRIGF